MLPNPISKDLFLKNFKRNLLFKHLPQHTYAAARFAELAFKMYFLLALAALLLAFLSEGVRAQMSVRDILAESGVSAETLATGFKKIKVMRDTDIVTLKLRNGMCCLDYKSCSRS